MKKLLSAIAAISMVAALAGCTNNNTSGSSDASSDSSTTTSAAENSAPEESTPAESTAEESAPEGQTTENSAPEGEGAGDNAENEQPADRRSAKLAEAVFNAVEFPAMMELNDAESIMGFLSIDTELCEEYYMSNAMMSVHLCEVIVAKPKAGSEEALQAQFDAHYDYIKNDPNAAFYPAQEVSAAGAVQGTTSDGYLYIIVHENGEQGAEALLAVE